MGSRKKRTRINNGQSKHETRLQIPGAKNITSIVILMLRKEDIKPLQFQRMLFLCRYTRERLQISSSIFYFSASQMLANSGLNIPCLLQLSIASILIKSAIGEVQPGQLQTFLSSRD